MFILLLLTIFITHKFLVKIQLGYNQGGAQGSNQNSFNNQNAPAQQNQFNKPAQSPAQSKPTAMPDGPVDDDIPF